MRFRHAASLALVGWYLMLPPVKDTPQAARQAPLREWTIIGSFDTATQCHQRKVEVERTLSKSDAPDFKGRVLNTLCIATDDARLAK